MKIDAAIPVAFADADTPSRYKVWYGGRGGGKSWSVGIILLLLATRRRMRVLCAREYQSSIADSVHSVLADNVMRLGLDGFYDVKRDEIVGSNGSNFIFAGLRHNASKIKSTEGVDVAWVEEANTISNESLDLLIPTIRKPDSEIWFTFNPDGPDDPVYSRFVKTEREDAIVRKVCWRDNPWFPDVLRRELEWDRSHDPDKYLHIWEGEPRIASNAQVFHGVWRIDAFETPEGAQFYHGADWGFSVDPSVMVRCFIDGRRLYIDAEAYGVGVDVVDTPALFDAIPTARKWRTVADSARPETISHMRRVGYNMVPAKKGKGSVEDGIAHLRGYEIVVHPRCKHTIDELRLYSYKLDQRTGEPTPAIEDKHNHCIDALRYATEPVMRNRRRPQVADVAGV